jgi:threonine synthase
MKYYSTQNPDHHVSLREAVLAGMAPHGGLFMPQYIPRLRQDFLAEMDSLSFQDISAEIARNFLARDLPPADLDALVMDAMDLDVRIKILDDSQAILETWHGPTMAFKDFGARFMARLMGYFMRDEDRKLTILVATSGDTGSAVASGFLKVPGIEVVILYPSGKVSPSQEKQLTTQGHNIRALEVSGTFDDCQRMVKQAFADEPLRKAHLLSSANSINIARLLPQSFYYAFAASRLSNQEAGLTVSVPCGNFGNLTAGLIAQRMGVPIHHFVASTNKNDVFPEYLATGRFQAQPSCQTLSNAMDVGNPSNLARIQDLFENDLNQMRRDISSYSFDDETTLSAIGKVQRVYDYVIDPHTAVGYLGLQTFKERTKEALNGVIVSTAHPAKFPESVEPAIGRKLDIPPQLAQYLGREKQATPISNDYGELKQYLMDTLE